MITDIEDLKETVFTNRLKEKDFSDDQVVKILSCLIGLCMHCLDDDESCRCWDCS